MSECGMAKYSEATIRRVCEGVARGEGLRSVCGPDRARGMPDEATAYGWLSEKPDFTRRVAQAREAWADLIIEEMLEISNGAAGDAKDVNRDKLRIETRKWLVAKLSPARYGDKAAPASGAEAPAGYADEAEEDAIAMRIAAILEAARLRKEARES